MSDQSSTVAPPVGTAAACVEFWDAAAEKGWFNRSSAKAVRIAFGKVMEIDEGWERVDLSTLDVDDQFSRFRTLKRNEYNDNSLSVYRSRFRQAVQTYQARNADDPNWKSYGPSTRSGGASVTKPTAGSKNKVKADSTDMTKAADKQTPPPAEPPSTTDQATPPSSSPGGNLTYVFPLRDDLDVTLSLPRDLTKGEADWLASFIGTLARPTKSQ